MQYGAPAFQISTMSIAQCMTRNWTFTQNLEPDIHFKYGDDNKNQFNLPVNVICLPFSTRLVKYEITGQNCSNHRIVDYI